MSVGSAVVGSAGDAKADTAGDSVSEALVDAVDDAVADAVADAVGMQCDAESTLMRRSEAAQLIQSVIQ